MIFTVNADGVRLRNFSDVEEAIRFARRSALRTKERRVIKAHGPFNHDAPHSGKGCCDGSTYRHG